MVLDFLLFVFNPIREEKQISRCNSSKPLKGEFVFQKKKKINNFCFLVNYLDGPLGFIDKLVN